MVIARIVAIDGNGRERNLPADESIAGVIALDPGRLGDVLEGLSFNGVRNIPAHVTQSLAEIRIGADGLRYAIKNLPPDKKKHRAGFASDVKYPVGAQGDWSRGSNWLTRHLLEIVEFISYGRRFDIKYALEQSARLKEQSGSIRLANQQSDKKGLHLRLEINGRDFGSFDAVSSLHLTRLE